MTPMTPFNMLLLLLVAVIVLREAASARPACTAKDMEGLRVVGYAFKRVFRFTDYTEMIDLYVEFRKIVDFWADLIRDDVGHLIHLHQGFDHRLMVLKYGEHLFNSSYRSLNLRDELEYYPWVYLTILDDASVDVVVSIVTYDNNFRSVDVRNKIKMRTGCHECGEYRDAKFKNFSSFIYDERLYFQGAVLNTRPFNFTPNARDLCVSCGRLTRGLKFNFQPEMQFPVIDIAVDPPLCINRVLKESTTGNSAEEEWIVSLVNGIRTTRSADPVLCYQPGGEGFIKNYVETCDGAVVLPNYDNYCYFLKKPGMETPCQFAYGSKYMFSDVQVEPADPVRMAMKTTSTAATPATTGPAVDPKPDEASGKKEPNSSETANNSWLLCGFLLIVISQGL